MEEIKQAESNVKMERFKEIEIEIHAKSEMLLREDRLEKILKKIQGQLKEHPHIKIKIICG